MKRCLFIVAPAGRCGTNFLAAGLAHAGLGTLSWAPEDYLIAQSHALVQYVEQLINRWSAWLSAAELRQRRSALLASLGETLLDSLAPETPDDRLLILKTPSAEGLEHAADIFPDSKIILLVRDGRDVAASAARAWPHETIECWADDWARGVDRMVTFLRAEPRDRPQRIVVRYESLVRRDPVTWDAILALIGQTGVSASVLDGVPVLGSSFERQDGEPFVWRSSSAPPDVMPVGRWKVWPPDVAAAIEQRIAPQLEALGYR
jgi:hypothetical protein